jgi:uncharacterized membrane protein YdjX (TVP38/TMEM64 family)
LIFILIIAYLIWGDLLSFHSIKAHQASLQSYAYNHYASSVALFILVFISTAFFVPGALILSLSGGFLFGTIPAVIYIDVGMTIGATLAFLSARYVLGNHFQHKFAAQLSSFNKEIKRHGPSYLIVLRMIPVMPFFVINYMAAMTKISVVRFVISTAVGVLPGAVIHAYIGEQLSAMESPKGLMTPKMIVALALMAILAMLPVAMTHWKKVRERKRSKRTLENSGF